jgi:hypothetical protein
MHMYMYYASLLTETRATAELWCWCVTVIKISCVTVKKYNDGYIFMLGIHTLVIRDRLKSQEVTIADIRKI